MHLNTAKNRTADISVFEIAVAHRQYVRVHLPGGSTFLHEMTSWPPS